jgi:magnesium chelatase subunit D
MIMRPTPEDSAWADALLIASVFALDPAGLAGVSVKAGVGPVRDRWVGALCHLLPPSAPVRRLPIGISDSRLLGGLDLAATLQAGRPIAERGILAEADGGIILLAMAERLEPATVARLGAVMDSGEVAMERDGFGLRSPARFGVVACDESVGEDEHPHPALLDRLAFHLDLDAIDGHDLAEAGPGREAIDRARARLGSVIIPEAILRAVCGTAIALGVSSMRPSLLALSAARGIAALAGHDEVTAEDAAVAARLVLAPRATRMPVAEPPQPEESEAPDASAGEPDSKQDGADQEDADTPDDSESAQPIQEMVLAAAKAAIPAGLLAQLRVGEAGRGRGKTSGRAGAVRQAAMRHGRPVGVRRGELRAGARLNLLETLRAAVPWQRLRRACDPSGSAAGTRIDVRREDFRIARMKHRAETTTIFVVDASGSSALNRLAEAKGAVELLLAECYVRRDRVALIAFRGRDADLLLPPTRSLVRAKRCLASLPGGGGTPLAAGIDAAAALADGVRRQGATPVVIVMTDGHANVARGGKTGRGPAEADARSAAIAVRAAGLTALLVDISPRSHPLAGRLAADMGATYLALPSADAETLSRNVRAAVQGPGDGRRMSR